MKLGICPRCGRNALKSPEVRNSLSRVANRYICEKCGMEEALIDAKIKVGRGAMKRQRDFIRIFGDQEKPVV